MSTIQNINKLNTESKELLEKELEEGYKANYAYYKQCQKEWDNADKETLTD